MSRGECLVGKVVWSVCQTACAVRLHHELVALERHVLAGAVENLEGAVVRLTFDIFREHQVGSDKRSVFLGVDGEHELVHACRGFPACPEAARRDVGSLGYDRSVHLGVAGKYDFLFLAASANNEDIFFRTGVAGSETDGKDVVPDGADGEVLGALSLDRTVETGAKERYCALLALVADHDVVEVVVECRRNENGVGAALYFLEDNDVGEEETGHFLVARCGGKTEFAARRNISERDFVWFKTAVADGVGIIAVDDAFLVDAVEAHMYVDIVVFPCLHAQTDYYLGSDIA